MIVNTVQLACAFSFAPCTTFNASVKHNHSYPPDDLHSGSDIVYIFSI